MRIRLVRWLSAAALVGAAQVAGRLLVVLIGGGWNRPTLAAVCLVGLAAALILLMLAKNWSAMVFGFALLQGACYGISSALRPMLIRDLLGQARIGAAQGAVLAPAFIAFGLAPLLAALIAAVAGYPALIIVCICLQFSSAAILARIPRASAGKAGAPVSLGDTNPTVSTGAS